MYQFPVEKDQQFAIIHPARKAADGPFESYAPKARVDVQVKANGLETEFVCFPEANSTDSTSCVGSFVPVLSKNVTLVQMVLCVNESDPNTAAIWEIDISKVGLKWPDYNLNFFFQANDSSKIQGVFMEAAKERFQLTQTIPNFNKQLTIVSIVGKRGVGKSTVASLLSGNHSMFETGSGSVGTTTTGADISTIIPTTAYADVLSRQLDIPFNRVSLEFF